MVYILSAFPHCRSQPFAICKTDIFAATRQKWKRNGYREMGKVNLVFRFCAIVASLSESESVGPLYQYLSFMCALLLFALFSFYHRALLTAPPKMSTQMWDSIRCTHSANPHVKCIVNDDHFWW